MKTYLRHRIHHVIDVKELIALEHLDFEGKYKDYVESHDFWEICYVTAGKITLFLENQTLTVGEHQLVLVGPNKRHSYSSPQGNLSRAFVVCFESFSQALNPLGGCIFEPDPVQLNCMKLIMEECQATFYINECDHLKVLPSPCFGGQQALLLQLEYLLISLVRRLSVEKNSHIVFCSDENFHADLVNVMIRYLRENLHQKISLKDICVKLNYSRSFLCKVFKEQTGETLITYYNRLKMEEAANLLKETSCPITDIASCLGFREVKYFDSLFKKHMGLSPKAYREKSIKQKKE